MLYTLSVCRSTAVMTGDTANAYYVSSLCDLFKVANILQRWIIWAFTLVVWMGKLRIFWEVGVKCEGKMLGMASDAACERLLCLINVSCRHICYLWGVLDHLCRNVSVFLAARTPLKNVSVERATSVTGVLRSKYWDVSFPLPCCNLIIDLPVGLRLHLLGFFGFRYCVFYGSFSVFFYCFIYCSFVTSFSL